MLMVVKREGCSEFSLNYDKSEHGLIILLMG